LHPVTVEHPSPTTRAWGSPSVTIACGAAVPTLVDADCIPLDGFVWTSPDVSADPEVWHRRSAPYLVVTMSAALAPASVLGAISDHLPGTGPDVDPAQAQGRCAALATP